MRPTVLIVEDSDSVRQVYASFLYNHGYEPLLAGDGREALEALSTRKPDLLLLDLYLPDMFGLDILEEVVRRFNEGSPYLPAVIVDTACQDQIGERMRSLSGDIGVRIEQVLGDDISVEYDLMKIVAAINRKGSPDQLQDLVGLVQKTIDLPQWKMVREVKALITGLDDSPEDARYRRQLESFIHDFLFMHIKFRTLAEERLTQGDEGAFFAYRTLVTRKMPSLCWHSRDTAEYAVRIGRLMGLGSDDIEILRYAGYFHDIGQLPAREFYSMSDVLPEDDRRRKFLPFHPQAGRILLEALGVDRALLVPVESHHANYDGTGYPNGYSRDGIPLYGAIRVAEMMDSAKRRRQDAISVERSDFERPTIEHVMAELGKYRGILFNPQAADAAIAYLQKAA